MRKISVFSRACSRFFSLNGTFTSWNFRGSRCSFSTTRRLKEDQNSGLDQESTVYADIVTDDTLKHPDYFGIEKLVSVKQLFDARVHFGHKEASLHNGMRQFVFGVRSEQVIFDLDVTAYHLRKALNFAAHIALRGGIILFVSRSPQNSFLIEESAKQCKEFAHTRRWYGTELTNSTVHFGAITRMPDLVILLSTLSELRKEHPAVGDAAKMNIPTIGVVDSNCCPDLITYPVPGNDDSESAVELYCHLFKEAIMLGKAERNKRIDLLNKAWVEEKAHQQLKQRQKV